MTADACTAGATRPLLAALTFRRTRAGLTRLLGRRNRAVALWWGFWLVGLNLTWVFLRSRADGFAAPVSGANVERAIFGGLPTLWLQENVYPLAPGVLEWVAASVHGSWFVAPALAAAVVTWKRPARLGSLFRWWAGLQAVSLLFFTATPVAPPWMDDRQVVRIVAQAVGPIEDSNPVSAVPSFHVALPLMIAMWFFRERWQAPALAMLAYSCFVALEVVFSGEHYVIDVIAAAAVASLVAAAARLDLAPLAGRLSNPVLRRRPHGLRLKPALERTPTEPGQSLIEFAFVLPIIMVFLLVLVDFGIALDRREVIQHAVREGARAGAVGATASEIIDTTVDQSDQVLDASEVTVCYVDGPDANSSPGNAGDNVRVSVDYTYSFSAGSGELLTAFGASVPSVNMTPHAEARLETPVSGATPCP
jgi:hypothetical protein